MKTNHFKWAQGMLDDISEISGIPKPRRFHHVLTDLCVEPPLLPSDTVLYRDEHLVVCPTLGSFLPFWYLILPTERHLNFSDWADQRAERCVTSEISGIVREVLGEFDNYIWFEHGPSQYGSITGCGVDHAHVHVLLDTNLTVNNILDTAVLLGVDDWNQTNLSCVYDERDATSEYLVFGNSSVGYLKNLSAPVGSQFFRRVLARLDGNREDWNYKVHAHHEFAQLSVDRVAERKGTG